MFFVSFVIFVVMRTRQEEPLKQQTDLSAENLVEMSAAPWRRRLLGLLASVQRVPACEDGVDVFEIRREGGQTVLRKVRPSRAGRRADADAAFVRVRTPKRRGRLRQPGSAPG